MLMPWPLLSLAAQSRKVQFCAALMPLVALLAAVHSLITHPLPSEIPKLELLTAVHPARTHASPVLMPTLFDDVLQSRTVLPRPTDIPAELFEEASQCNTSALASAWMPPLPD